MGESIRLEVITSHRNEFNFAKEQLTKQLQETVSLVSTLSEKHSKTREALKELSLQTSKSLAKKVDIKEFLCKFKDFSQNKNDQPSKRPSGDESREFDFLIQNLKLKERNLSSKAVVDHDDAEDEVLEDSLDAIEVDDSLLLSQSKLMTPAAKFKTAASSHKKPAESSIKRPLKTNAGPQTHIEKTVLDLKDNVKALQTTLSALKGEVDEIKKTKLQSSVCSPMNTSFISSNYNNSIMQNELDKLDWRLALGEIAMNLRSEMSLKANREEMLSVVRAENDGHERRLKVCFSISLSLDLSLRLRRHFVFRLLRC